VPVVSWLWLRGRCRDCRAPISPRYPLVEAATAMLFCGAALRYGRDAALPALLAFLAGLLALALIDADTLRLPRKVVYPLLGIVAVLFAGASIWTKDYRPLWIGAVCAVVWFVVFYAINRIDERFLGFGDVRLALVLGLGLGYLSALSAVLGFFAANVVGAAIGLSLIASRRMQRDRPLPYGVFLAVGAAIAVYVGPIHLHLHLRGT
jgi:leader peptidase (prepilin peptidase) / N-methyltransferase